jgi:hypothetical protein
MTPSREVRRLLASCLAGLGERATHVLVADPSYGATYDLEAAFRTVRAGRSWWPPRSTVSPTATTGEHLDTGEWVRLRPVARPGAAARADYLGRSRRGHRGHGDVGMMSDAGELLRRAAIPSRLAAPPQGRR